MGTSAKFKIDEFLLRVYCVEKLCFLDLRAFPQKHHPIKTTG